MAYYEFLVRDDGIIDLTRVETETGLRCTPLRHAARLDGELVDRAAVHRVIAGVCRLGLELVAVDRRSSRHAL